MKQKALRWCDGVTNQLARAALDAYGRNDSAAGGAGRDLLARFVERVPAAFRRRS